MTLSAKSLMPRLTKDELISEMARLGKMPPKEWTMMEISLSGRTSFVWSTA